MSFGFWAHLPFIVAGAWLFILLGAKLEDHFAGDERKSLRARIRELEEREPDFEYSAVTVHFYGGVEREFASVDAFADHGLLWIEGEKEHHAFCVTSVQKIEAIKA